MKIIATLSSILLVLFITGCSEEDNTRNFQKLISAEKIDGISTDDIVAYWGNNDAANTMIRFDVEVHRLVYETEDVDGELVMASGALLIPIGIDNPMLLSIQHATFFADEEAPSENGTFSVVSRKAIFASAGHILFLPDYIGYGETSDLVHPYFQKQTLARSSYDFIMAGKEYLTDLGVGSIDQPVHLAGYSEGAYATLALANLIEAEGVEIEMGLVSLGSGAYDLEATVAQFVNDIESPMPCIACNAFFIYAYHHYHELGSALSAYIHEPYASTIQAGLLNGGYNASEIAGELPTLGSALFTDEFVKRFKRGEEQALQSILRENSISRLPESPLLIIHGNADGVAPVFNSQVLAQAASAQGKDVRYIELPEVNHFDGILDWGLLTLQELDKLR